MVPRQILIQRLEKGHHPDIVIVGGGCNGAGLFRDLCLQGVPTLLVEKRDFSSGASAAPTRLAHGGLKYLETGEISLVRESAEERNLLLVNAPHQVRPLKIWVPLRSWFGGALLAPLRFLGIASKPGGKGVLAVKAGLVVYDRFGSFRRTLPRHRMVSRAQARRLVPQLSDRIRAVAEYHDSLMTQPERLVIEMIDDGERACPEAMAIPYMEATGLSEGALGLRDAVSGRTFPVKPRLVINMAGAWADQVQSGLGLTLRMVGGTKGSHVVVRNRTLADTLDGRMLYFEADDMRFCIVLPLGEDRLFLGATDMRSDEPDDKRCSDEEIDYIFGVMKAVLPGIAFSHEDIVYTVAGVRPLPLTEGVSPGEISRDHKFHKFQPTDDRPFHVFTLVGGKWTTFRACAEQVADAVLSHLGQSRTVSTRNIPIGGGREFPIGDEAQENWAKELAVRAGIGEARAKALAWRYGSRAAEVANAESECSGEPMMSGFSPAEIDWIAVNERITRLEDIVQRRTLLAFEGKLTRESLEWIAGIAARRLGWNEARQAEEIEATAALVTERHRLRLDAA